MHPFKILETKVKDISKKDGIVTFYYNAFNNIDSDKDVSLPGSHQKSQLENIKRIKHFKNHDFYKVPGVIQEMGEDNYGAWARSQLMNTTVGRDTLEEYDKGAITEHSFGFEVIKSYEENNVRYIQEYKIWEVSSLTGWGANENTSIISLKNEKQALQILNSLLSLKKGEITKEIERKINEIFNYIKSLNEEPDTSTLKNEPDTSTLKNEPIITAEFIQKKLYNFFK